MEQSPAPGTRILAVAGDCLEVSLRLSGERRSGRAFFRTNLGQVAVRRQEIVARTERDETPLARDWHDIPMVSGADGAFWVRVPFLHVGCFAGKTFFLPDAAQTPEWPDGENLAIKVGPACSVCGNTIYTAFVRQFGPSRTVAQADPARRLTEQQWDGQGYTVIPPSGTFRDLIRQLDVIFGAMHFRILQLLPIHPTPTTYGRMGRFGSPFAGLDFFTVDPALAEFDRQATPLEQFRELVDAVHARSGRLFLDIPANHTGWASTLQNHHPEWFRRDADGTFLSPGAWGVVWEDLVELDYSHPGLRSTMAEVFLFWARQGADGFRCDAGYMIPAETWTYIVARVRAEFPDTVFLLEGLGGAIAVTEQLLAEANLDWAYSELFQTHDRPGFERYLPAALDLGQRTGPLVHFAETHDNNRLAVQGETYARMRTALAALLSQHGAFGIANGVEWFATEKIDVHGASPLNWGSARNQVPVIGRINSLLAQHPAFSAGAKVRQVQTGAGNVLAVLRTPSRSVEAGGSLLVLVNLDAGHAHPVHWAADAFPAPAVWDFLSGSAFHPGARNTLELAPGQILCLTADSSELTRLEESIHPQAHEPERVLFRRRTLLALRIRHWITGQHDLDGTDPEVLGADLTRDPVATCASFSASGWPHLVHWNWPGDLRRTAVVPPGCLLLVRAPHPFRVRLVSGSRVLACDESLPGADGTHFAVLPQDGVPDAPEGRELAIRVFAPQGVSHDSAPLLALPDGDHARVLLRFNGQDVRAGEGRYAVLGNGRGASAQIRASWGEIRSQYDALLAVNPDPRVPVDRQVFFTRCRAWLRHCGYSHAIDASCLESFQADPSGRFAYWRFRVPTGVGRWVGLGFRLSISQGRNRLRFEILRESGVEGLSDADGVTVVLRPDIEWRSFHCKTKAYAGPEQHWPGAVQPEPHGFCFRPAPGEVCSIRAERGRFYPDAQWTYQVEHAEDAERGLDGKSDLFSPGWFGIDLLGGERDEVIAEREDVEPALTRAIPRETESVLPSPGPDSLTLPDALRRAIDLFVVRRDDGLTVIAGYPWFLDWGRDTLLALRGIVSAGRAEDALRILREFGRFERQGTLPNMIRGNDHSNRDTSDAALWFGVAAGDLIRALGREAVLNLVCGNRPLREVLVSIAEHMREGTPNGIRMDPASGLVFSPAHFTWMDTNHPAATPREGYPIEIQALWIAFLDMLSEHVDPAWQTLAKQARHSLERLYWLKQEGWLADNLRGPPGTPAAKAVADDALRPNQLLAITLGAFHGRPGQAASILRACESLLVPGGIRSLADRPVRMDLPISRNGQLLNDPRHPYWGQYTGDEDTRRKPAYHNGTAWTWQFPLYAEAMVRVYGDEVRPVALALLGSATPLLNAGCVGQVPEILDGDSPHRQRGCGAQAWGVSELLRVWQWIDSKG